MNFVEYLKTKKSVDDRALNRHVLDVLAHHLPPDQPGKPLQVLEVAAGIGTMLQRLVAWDILGSCVYTAVDLQPELIAAARQSIPQWAADNGFQVSIISDETLELHRAEQRIRVILEGQDVLDYLAGEGSGQQWDLIIANAFLDLVDPAVFLPELFAALRPGGFYYFTINFAGETILLPEIDPHLDREIMQLYHRSMDDRGVGSSMMGRDLFSHLPGAGAEIIAAGSSDWVVHPGPDGYPADEDYFLHCILDFFQSSVPPLALFDINPWLKERRRQIADAELVFIAHQYDFFGRLAS